MKTYELTGIISPSLTLDQANTTAKEVESLIQNKEGVILKSEKTAIKTLAYPIKKQSSAYFFILEFQIQEGKIKELRDYLEKEKNILRHFIIVKKLVKNLKKGRVRRPLFIGKKLTAQRVGAYENIEKTAAPLKVVDLDKKIDELLNE